LAQPDAKGLRPFFSFGGDSPVPAAFAAGGPNDPPSLRHDGPKLRFDGASTFAITSFSSASKGLLSSKRTLLPSSVIFQKKEVLFFL